MQVSRAIMLLEHRLQAQLFLRTSRVVRLTDTCLVFLDHCQRLLHDRDEAIALITKGGEPEGELRLTCSTAMGERFLAPLMRRFALQHPRLSVVVDLTNRLVDLMSERSEEHTSELQSLMRISYAVFCLKKKK